MWECACYLVEEAKPRLSFRMFRLLTADGTPGLCITRIYPDIAREKYPLRGVRVVWLADAPEEDSLRPMGIVNLSKTIEDFIEQHPEGCAILLDGIEFLILRNGFDPVLSFVAHLNEFVMRRKAIVLLPVSPATLERKELARLERDLEVADVAAWRAELDAREWSRRLGG